MKWALVLVLVGGLLVGAVGTYSISGFSVKNPSADCESSCRLSHSFVTQSCTFEGRLLDVDFFVKNICDQTKIGDCMKNYCGNVTILVNQRYDECFSSCMGNKK